MGIDYVSRFFYGIIFTEDAIKGEEDNEIDERDDTQDWLETTIKKEKLEKQLVVYHESSMGDYSEKPVWIIHPQTYFEIDGRSQSVMKIDLKPLTLTQIAEFKLTVKRFCEKYQISLNDTEEGYFITNEVC